MLFRRVAEVVENHSGLDPGNAPLRVNFQNLVHVLGKVENDGDVAALTGERRATATAQNGSAILARQADRGYHVIDVARKDYSDGDLAVVGAVGGVQRTAAGIEADFATDVIAQGAFQPSHVHQGGPGSTADFYKIWGHSPGLVVGIATID